MADAMDIEPATARATADGEGAPMAVDPVPKKPKSSKRFEIKK